MKQARGRWLFFLDGDDYLDGLGTGELVTRVVAGELDVACGDFGAGDGGGKRLREDDHQFESLVECLRSMYKAEHFFQQSFVVKRWMFEEVGGFDEGVRTGEDFELCPRLLLAGYNSVYVPGIMYNHVIHEESLSTARRFDKSRHRRDVTGFYGRHEFRWGKLGGDLLIVQLGRLGGC